MMIPEPVMPTRDEMVEVSTKWWRVHEGINLIDWNDELVKHSIPFGSIKIPYDLAEEMLSIPDKRNAFDSVYEKFDSVVSPQIASFGWMPFFAKLITRSPKDMIEPVMFTDTRQLLRVLTGSMRTFEDMCLLVYIDKCVLIIRPFVSIEKKDEFRVFVKDGVITGISQYHYFDTFYYSEAQVYAADKYIRQFTETVLITNCTKKSFVADLLIDETNGITLIELNPYWLSDPCLFESYDNLDGSFKYVLNSEPNAQVSDTTEGDGSGEAGNKTLNPHA